MAVQRALNPELAVDHSMGYQLWFHCNTAAANLLWFVTQSNDEESLLTQKI